MILLRDSSPLPAACHGAVAAMGNFDGLHLGHKAVIGKAVTLAKAAGKPSMVMTFEPHPRRILRPDLPQLRIQPLHEKFSLLKEMGVDFVRVLYFNRKLLQTSAENFIRRVLIENLKVTHIVTGEDFIFGHNRGGNAAMLAKMGASHGFAATACPSVLVAGMRCSSTRIREALALGDIQTATALLGRPYVLGGRVQQGDKRGRQLGFPTANLFPAPIFLPAYGVYAVRVKIGGRQANGVANLGLRPTFGGSRVRFEVHLFDWQEPIYGERLDAELAAYIRPERKFDSLESLKEQISEDCGKAKSHL